MKNYPILSEECTWREVYDAYNDTAKNLNDIDFLYKSNLSNGQLYDVVENVGYVNGQPAYRNTNITITSDYIANFKISGFKFYNRETNSIIDIDINCNLYQYEDNKPHFLYLVLSDKGKYEVYDSMFEEKSGVVLFARFVINTNGNATQFYVIAPFAGSPDYIKGNTFYDVAEGLNLTYYSQSNKQFTLTPFKVRFSGINFDDYNSPDVIHLDKSNTNIKFKYAYWDTADALPRINWSANDAVDNLIVNKLMNYTSGAISDLAANKFSIQKVYYDIYSNTFAVMYGNTAYDDITTAVVNSNTILDYPKLDGMDYLIPVAIVIVKNSTEAFSNETIRIIGLTYDETELFDSNDIARQQSTEALLKAEQAIQSAADANTNINNHIQNITNPHGVTKAQVGLGSVENYAMASQTEAETGASNERYMSPLRTKQSIEANAVVNGVTTSGIDSVVLKIQPTQPAAESGKIIVWINTSS